MKRVLCLLLALTMALALAACGAPEPENTEPVQSQAAETAPPTQPTEPPLPRLSLEEPLTLIDTEQFTIALTSARFDSPEQMLLSLHAENRTDKSLQFLLEEIYLDGILAGFSSQITMSAGSSELHLPAFFTGLSKLDLAEPSDYWFHGQILTMDSEPVAAGDAHHYPQGQENARIYRHKAEDPSQVLLDLPEARVVFLGSASPDYMDGGSVLHVYLENLTDTDLAVVADKLHLNGAESSAYGFHMNLKAGTGALTQIYLQGSDMQYSMVGNLETLRMNCYLPESGRGQYINLARDPVTGEFQNTAKGVVTFENPAPLIDTDQVTVTILSINPSHSGGMEVQAELENKTRTSLVVGMTPEINHFQYYSNVDYGNFGYSVFMLDAKAKDTVKVVIPISRMDYLGVGEPGSIRLHTRVLDVNDDFFDEIFGASSSVYAQDLHKALAYHPSQLGTALFGDMTLRSYPRGQEADCHFVLDTRPGDAVFCQGEGFRATYLDCVPTRLGERTFAMNLYLENSLEEGETPAGLSFECTAIVDGNRRFTETVRVSNDSSAYAQLILDKVDSSQEISLEVAVVLRDNVLAPAVLSTETIPVTLP